MVSASKNNAVKRSHRLVELLASRYFDGATNKELAGLLRTSPANISRDLATLEELGYAKKLDSGKWGLTSKPLAIFRAFTTHYETLEERMRETNRNIMVGARNL